LSWFCKENFNSSVKLLRAGGLQVSSFAGCAGEFPDGAYFNTAHLSGRNLRGDLDGLVQVLGVNQIETCQTLLGFRERAIGDGQFSVTDPNRFRGTHGLQRFRGQASAGVAKTLVVSHTFIVGHGPDLLFFAVNQA